MTEIEIKVNTVVGYIQEKKGVNIGNIKLIDGDDLAKLHYAFNIAINYFKSKK